MKKELTVTAIGLVLLGFSFGSVYGQAGYGLEAPGRTMGGRQPGFMYPLMLRAVNLTPEQKAQVQKIMAAHRPAYQGLFRQLSAAQKQMADRFFVPGEVKEADFASQTQRIAQLRSQLTQEGLKEMLEIRRVLTSEQMVKAAQVRQKLEALRSEMRSLFENK